MIILGIETSCDDTAAGILKDGCILSNIAQSNRRILDIYGGVVPELTARMHQKYINTVVKQALKQADMTIRNIDLIAVTTGPGLLRSLLVGVNFAKTLAVTTQKSLIGINHLEGHVLSGHLQHKINFPFICLLISGGHTMIILVEKLGRYHIIGQTVDDSAGETFDKVSQMLKLKNIGGAIVENYAKQGVPGAFILPKPMINSGNLNFSFSGLKTSIKNLIKSISPLNWQQQCDLCLAVQHSIASTIVKKIKLALSQWQKKYPRKSMTLVTVGGVASNKYIQQKLQNICEDNQVKLIIPAMNLCTDNAVMIANVAYLKTQGIEDWHRQSLIDVALRTKTMPIWPLSQLHTN